MARSTSIFDYKVAVVGEKTDIELFFQTVPASIECEDIRFEFQECKATYYPFYRSFIFVNGGRKEKNKLLLGARSVIEENLKKIGKEIKPEQVFLMGPSENLAHDEKTKFDLDLQDESEIVRKLFDKINEKGIGLNPDEKIRLDFLRELEKLRLQIDGLRSERGSLNLWDTIIKVLFGRDYSFFGACEKVYLKAKYIYDHPAKYQLKNADIPKLTKVIRATLAACDKYKNKKADELITDCFGLFNISTEVIGKDGAWGQIIGCSAMCVVGIGIAVGSVFLGVGSLGTLSPITVLGITVAAEIVTYSAAALLAALGVCSVAAYGKFAHEGRKVSLAKDVEILAKAGKKAGQKLARSP